ncbi:ABC transporter permease [Candidatus Viridilinea mediisalina]|uniref:ABC transporter permease n=1 Tax=Candidatus Viridilinea mediisalina TaxID=2024553 RepID=A0A2A6RGI3_9CHLR|nr:ABC transporter permease subunit [Candidatus Viridilinea mediisalina]PDW02177.1 ABC transporter permease [Candidatus Viridilinea mediisalina]
MPHYGIFSNSLLRRYLTASCALLLILGLLQWGLPAAGIPSYLLPTPWQVGESLIERRSELLQHAWFTALAACLGLALGSITGLALAISFVLLRLLEDAFYPWVLVSQAIPAAALAPLFTIWFGDGLAPRVAMAALFAFFPVLVSAARGLRQVAPEEVALMRAWGASGWAMLWHLRWPAALPSIFAGLRVAAALAVVGVIVSELSGSGRGLGFVISVASYRLHMDRVFAAVALAAGLSLLLHGLLLYAERRIVFWRQNE